MHAHELAAAIESTVRAEQLRGASYGAGAVAGCVVLLTLLVLLVIPPAHGHAMHPGRSDQ